MPSLYELNEQMLAIDRVLDDNTDPESLQILESAKEQLGKDIESKMENIIGYITECRGKVDYYKTEIARIEKKKKILENRIEWLKRMVFDQMKISGKTKAEYGTYTVMIAKSPEKVVLTEDADKWLPDNMCRITRLPNRTAIKEAMGDSKELKVIVDDREIIVARLETENENLRIK